MRKLARCIAIGVPLVLLVACTSNEAVAPAAGTTSAAASTSVAPVVSTPAPKPSATATPKPKPTVTTAPRTTAKPRPVVHLATARDPLTGGALSANPVLAVKIDNTFFEVPQFGIADADVVFVEQVEGGLTRLIGIFHSKLDVEVGPVRSVRSTDSQLLPVFGQKPVLVFSGGQAGTLDLLAKSGVVDGSAFGDAYFRSDAAYGTYNLHAQLDKLAAAAKSSGLTRARSIGFVFAASDPRVDRSRAATAVSVTMEAATTDFSYVHGRYVRYRYGEPLSDYQGRLQTADNVVVQHVHDEPDGFTDSLGSPSYLSHTVGHGKVTLYRDGHAIDGTWTRRTVNDPFSYVDGNGRPLPFKPGNTWIILAPQTAQVSGG